MLEALLTSREQQKRLVLDASHELRTPSPRCARTSISSAGPRSFDAEQRSELLTEADLELRELDRPRRRARRAGDRHPERRAGRTDRAVGARRPGRDATSTPHRTRDRVRAHRARAGQRSRRAPGTRGFQPRRERVRSSAPTTPRSKSSSTARSSRSSTAVRESHPTISRTCSTASTGRRPRGRFPGRAWAWPSSSRSRSCTAGRSPCRPAPAAGPSRDSAPRSRRLARALRRSRPLSRSLATSSASTPQSPSASSVCWPGHGRRPLAPRRRCARSAARAPAAEHRRAR